MTTTARQTRVSCQPAPDWATPTLATPVQHTRNIHNTNMTISSNTIIQTADDYSEFSEVIIINISQKIQ